jgi:D-lactate dehydrogenase
MTTLQAAVFDTKPYERESLQRAASSSEIEWRFMDWRLSAETAAAAQGARAICIFVNAQPQLQ